MLSISGFQKAFEYIDLIKQGMICTLSLSALTVLEIDGYVCRQGARSFLRTAYAPTFRLS